MPSLGRPRSTPDSRTSLVSGGHASTPGLRSARERKTRGTVGDADGSCSVISTDGETGKADVIAAACGGVGESCAFKVVSVCAGVGSAEGTSTGGETKEEDCADEIRALAGDALLSRRGR